MILKQFVSFTAVGAVGTAAHYSALVVLVQFMHVGPVPASGASDSYSARSSITS